MDTLGIISSVSKIAVIAFIITLGVVVFEIVTLMKKNREREHPKEDVHIPEFNQAKASEHHFTELPDIQATPVMQERKRIPRAVVFIGGITIIVLVTALAVWIFNQSALSVRRVKKETSPIAESDKLTPTNILSPTGAVWGTPGVGSMEGENDDSLSPTTVQQNVTTTLTKVPTYMLTQAPSISATKASAIITTTTSTAVSKTPSVSTSPGMPQSGSFQTTLLIMVVSVTLIYLAFIL